MRNTTQQRREQNFESYPKTGKKRECPIGIQFFYKRIVVKE
jgi:hypothetical protein